MANFNLSRVLVAAVLANICSVACAAPDDLLVALSERPSEYERKRLDAMRKADAEAKARWAAEKAKGRPPADGKVYECRYLHMLGNQTVEESSRWNLAENHFHEWDKAARGWGPNLCTTAPAGLAGDVRCSLGGEQIQLVATYSDATGFTRTLQWTLNRADGQLAIIERTWLKKASEGGVDLYGNKNGQCKPAAAPNQ